MFVGITNPVMRTAGEKLTTCNFEKIFENLISRNNLMFVGITTSNADGRREIQPLWL